MITISSKKEKATINQKYVLSGFQKYFLYHFLTKRKRLLIPWGVCIKITNIREICHLPELYAHKIVRILF